MDLESSKDSMAKSSQIMSKVAGGYKRHTKIRKTVFIVTKKMKYLRINVT